MGTKGMQLHRVNPLRNEDGASILIVLVLVVALMIVGMTALRIAGTDVKTSGNYKKVTQSLYIAEAGAERARAALVSIPLGSIIDGTYDQLPGLPMSFGTPVFFGAGTYSVVLSALADSSGEGGGVYTGDEDPFVIEDDDVVRTTRMLDMSVRALGSAVTYGEGGPEVEVRVEASLNGGDTWNTLYYGNDIDGSEVEVFSCQPEGTQIVLRINGHYDGGAGSFDETFESNDGTGHVLVLRDGDPAPDYDPFDDQESLDLFLQEILDETGHIAIGENDVVFLVELGSVSGSAADFQDGVILVEFVEPSTGCAAEATLETFMSTSGVVTIQSTGQAQNGAVSVVEARVHATGSNSTRFCAAIMSKCLTETNGNLIVDGRDHDLAGNLTGAAGVVAISTRDEYVREGSSTVGGHSSGIDYVPTQSDPGFSAVTEEYATNWGDPDSPEEVLGIPEENKLKEIAQSGVNGSQYVTDPLNLTFPLSGVTYVELEEGGIWQDIAFGNSTGILVVHNSTTDATMKNTNSGSFKGIMIIDYYIKIHCDIYGSVVTLREPGEGVKVIGNGEGHVRYSSVAIEQAMQSVSSYLEVLSWRDVR